MMTTRKGSTAETRRDFRATTFIFYNGRADLKSKEYDNEYKKQHTDTDR